MTDAARYFLNRPVATLVLASALLVGTAYVFQYGFGYAPCKLCYWQRYPYLLIIVIGAMGLALPSRLPAAFLVPFLVGLLAIDAGIAFYHVGVEQHWWQGPATCSGLSLTGDTAADLETLMKTPVVRCDEIPWSFLGLSMAAWNGLAALALAAFGLAAIMTNRKGEQA